MKPTTALFAAAIATAAVTASADGAIYDTAVRYTAMLTETTHPMPNAEVKQVWLEGLVVTPTHTYAAHEWKARHLAGTQHRFELHPLQRFAVRCGDWLRSFMQSFAR